jgi:hypothetical protein
VYSTCIHCQSKLGANEVIEAFPVGRRVAFDGGKGRLWVVCQKCSRWNLAPFDARWEALEECEKAFRSTRIRVSTDEIGLARLADGTDLIRIGAPQRPEFAAWRYGDQFGRRRKYAILMGVGVTAAVGVGAAGFVAVGAGLAAVMPIFHVINIASIVASGATRRVAHPHPEGGYFAGLGPPRLIQRPDVEEGWGIDYGFSARFDTPPSLRMPVREWLRQNNNQEIGRLSLRGNEAIPVLRRVLPGINKAGANRTQIADGVRMIESVGDPAQFGAWAASQRSIWGAQQYTGDTGDLSAIPPAARLAFEMALNEENERRALDGELALLEAAWRDAEEIAHIADSLALPAGIEARHHELKAPPSAAR